MGNQLFFTIFGNYFRFAAPRIECAAKLIEVWVLRRINKISKENQVTQG